ncbi:hypothetical protein F1880_008639 [Penicillium rolfsii]|nr:hypothetical protein F1880_008639 [Penicillium rolfsii]
MDPEFRDIVELIESVGPDDPLGSKPHRSSPVMSIRVSYDGPTDDPIDPTIETAQIREMRRDGFAIQQMLRNPSVACPIPRINLQLTDLDPQNWVIEQSPSDILPGGYKADDMIALELPYRGFLKITMDAWHSRGENDAEFVGCWKGRAAPGVLFIEHVVRKKWGPWSWELCKVAYEQVADLSTLKSVFVCHVMNTDTRPQVKTISPHPELRLFTCGKPGYQTLLGTRIGKVVSYFILGAFGQGVKRIPRIAVWYVGVRQDVLQMRFDIADVGQGD